MKENEKFLVESIDLLSREFGQPLPTLSGVMEKHQDSKINEEQYFDPNGELKKYMDKVLKQAGIRVIKYDPMKQSFHNGAWGGFYTVASSNKVDMPGHGKVKRSSAVLPVYIDKKGQIELGVSGDGFKLGKAGSSQVLKNLKDFKKGDLDESVSENIVLETPGAIAAAAATAVLRNPKGKDIKVSTALKSKEHPLHKKALNWVKSKMKKKDEPKKQSKSDSDFYRKQYESILDEATQKQEIQTEFGRFKIVHGENVTAPGNEQEYFFEVNLNNKYLGHFMIEGDPEKKGGKFEVTIHKGFKQVGIK